MTRRPALSIGVYADSFLAGPNADPVEAGIAVLNEVAPYFRLRSGIQTAPVGGSQPDIFDGDSVILDRTFDADLNVILTTRSIHTADVRPAGGAANTQGSEVVGLAYPDPEIWGKRAVLVDVGAIRRPEHVVAHEIGHLLALPGTTDEEHCQRRRCVMYAYQPTTGRADRHFCDADAELLHEHADKLRLARAGKLAVFGKRIF